MRVTDSILQYVQETADEFPLLFQHKGPGEGNRSTNAFMDALNKKVIGRFGREYVEQYICGETKQNVDFYIPDEKTVIEVELSLYNVHTNLDRDIFKVLLARDAGHEIETLVLIGKKGAVDRHAGGASRALIKWVSKHHRLEVVIRDIRKRETPNKVL